MTIGVHGDGGPGKSSVLKMLEVPSPRMTASLCLWLARAGTGLRT